MKQSDKCKCCDGSPLVGWFGLCQACQDAVDRYLTNRRTLILKARTGK